MQKSPQSEQALRHHSNQYYMIERWQQYQHCSCVTSDPRAPLPTYMAMTGKCESSCDMLPLFMAVFFFIMFFTFVISMPALSATLRSGDTSTSIVDLISLISHLISLISHHRYHWYLITDITGISSQISLVSHHRYHWYLITDITDISSQISLVSHHSYLITGISSQIKSQKSVIITEDVDGPVTVGVISLISHHRYNEKSSHISEIITYLPKYCTLFSGEIIVKLWKYIISYNVFSQFERCHRYMCPRNINRNCHLNM